MSIRTFAFADTTGDASTNLIFACEAIEAAAAEVADALDVWTPGAPVTEMWSATGSLVDAATVMLCDVDLSWTCDRDRQSSARALHLARVSLGAVAADLGAHPARRLASGHVRDVAALADKVAVDWLRAVTPAPVNAVAQQVAA